jgi:hypothetical protein
LVFLPRFLFMSALRSHLIGLLTLQILHLVRRLGYKRLQKVEKRKDELLCVWRLHIHSVKSQGCSFYYYYYHCTNFSVLYIAGQLNGT